ncbi:interleukin-17 receptor B [Sceloporus undulatus]|uniref:interleukin-17 receptor B n=1 Tax=Sceloporus undulatus TaxID=8520 RepID=UPI001C4DBCC2|nr:interleukin-17 receptor B [Sceloporus undulatus]
MDLAAPVLLLLLLFLLWLSGAQGEASSWPFVVCHAENGPSPELMMKHRFTPSDLSNLSAKIVETNGTCQFNITWILKADASIKYLNATKICVSSGKPSCIRCDYTEKFQSQTRSDHQKWQFHFVGFPVEENKEYMIEVFNLPPANILEDHPETTLYLSSPGCRDDIFKYCNLCIEKGSLWDPNITVCYTESEVEVDFTPSPFCPEYKIHLCESDECDDPADPTDYSVFTSEGNNTRISKRIPVNGQRRKIFRELIPYFPKCRNDCRRYSDYQELCTEVPGKGKSAGDLTGIHFCIIAALFLIVCTLAAIFYFKRRHGTAYNWALFYPMVKQTPVTVLVVYSQDACFQHKVLVFAEFLRECCHCDVIIDVWQKRKIAETGPVQWLAAQKEIADKIIFLSSSHTSMDCDSVCQRTIECNKNSECMFTLALNLFCSDLKNQSSFLKYMVVSFNETYPAKSISNLLNSCPKYFLMKDMDSFCRDLYLSPSERIKTKCCWRFKDKVQLEI